MLYVARARFWPLRDSRSSGYLPEAKRSAKPAMGVLQPTIDSARQRPHILESA